MKGSKTSSCEVPEWQRGCSEPVQNIASTGKMDLPTTCRRQHPRRQNLGKSPWLTSKPRSISANVLVAARYLRTHCWDTPQHDWETWNECTKWIPKKICLLWTAQFNYRILQISETFPRRKHHAKQVSKAHKYIRSGKLSLPSELH